MKLPKPIIIFALQVALLMSACDRSESTKSHEPRPSDTLYTEAAAIKVYAKQPELALAIIDSAVAVGNLDKDHAPFLRAYIYSHNVVAPRFDTAWHICDSLMESDFVKKSSARESVLDLLVYITHRQRNYEQCLRWSTEKIDFCRQQGEETEVLRTEAEIGVILVKLGEEEKGLSMINNVIASLDGQQQLDEMDACIIALKRKIQILQELDREEEVIPVAKHIAAIINDYRQHSDNYENNSYRLKGKQEEMEDYCNFYTAQSSAYLAHSYATIGATDSARHFLSLFEASDFGHTLDGRQMIAPTWCLLGDYGKMLATYDDMDLLLGADTMNLEYIEMLRGRAIAANAMGNSHAAVGFWQRYSNLIYHVIRQIYRTRVNEYAVHYQLKEERLNAEHEHIKARNSRTIAVLLGGLFLTAICFIAKLLMLHRDIKRKNHVLAKQIAEKIQLLQHQMASQIPNDFNTLDDTELFTFLSEAIHREELYLDPHFDRQTLIDRFAIPKERIGAAFSKGSTFPSLASYLNEERLLHAARLLTEEPEMSVADIAVASGFANGSAFARKFKSRFTITPSQFREESPVEA